MNASNQQLKATSAKLLETTQAVETAVDGIAISDLEGNLVFINQAFAGMHGLKAEDLIGKGMGIFHTPEQLASDVQSHLAQMMKKGSANGEVWHVRQDGSTFPTFMSTSIVKDEAGKPVRMIGVARDITEQKKAEEALRIKDGAIESSINAIAIADMQGNLNYVNSAFLKLWGYGTPAEVLGKSVLGFWQMGDKAAEITDAVQVKGGWIGELVAQRKDGSLLDVQISASMVVDPAGRPVCMQGAFIDITERKKAEEALKQSEEKVKAYN